MEAPDKIFINEDVIALHILQTKYDGDIEYIRKDALLEWAKEAHDSGPIKDSADKGDAWSIGYLCGMKDLIDKLKTL